MILIYLFGIAYFATTLTLTISVQDTSIEEADLIPHHRTRRIANRPSKKRLNSSSINSTVGGDNDDIDVDYPEGYFLPPGKTDAPEAYDYDAKKFNRSYLTKAEWRDGVTNRSRTYKVTGKPDKNALPIPVDPMEDIDAAEPISSLMGF